MYIPGAFAKAELPVLHDFMRSYPFATLITHHEGSAYASHVPVVLDGSAGEKGVLIGHLARNNQQCRDFSEGAEVLAIFHGPHGYVSPAWYEPSPMSVPTWNYAAVHAYGDVRLLTEEELIEVLHRQTETYEKSYADSWKLQISSAMKERMLGAIAGFEIKLQRIEGKFKLSQNRSEQDRRNVIANLSRDEAGRELAHWMSGELNRG